MNNNAIIKYTVKQKEKKVWVVKALNTKQFINNLDTFIRLDKDDKIRLWYIKYITSLLEVEEEEIIYLLDDIYSYAEFDEVASAICSLKGFLTSFKKKDNKNGHRLPRKFYKLKNKFIEELKLNNQYIEAEKIEKIEYKIPKYYQDELYNNKQILFSTLTRCCNCSTYRAKEIIKLLEEI